MRGPGTGIFVGIPLTLLQVGLHQKTGAHLDLALFANNFLLGSAIYDADRIPPGFSAERAPTQIAALLSASYYATHPGTEALAPLALGLHAGYADLKTAIAPAKPFVIGLLWTLCVYYAPLWATPGVGVHDVLVPAWLCLSIAALSHLADIVDVDDDRSAGIATPAVLLEEQALPFAFALATCAALLHEVSPTPLLLYDLFVLSVVLGFQLSPLLGALSAMGLLSASAVQSRAEVASGLLQSTEGLHRASLSALVRGVDMVSAFPETCRPALLNALFGLAEGGDAVGSGVLKVYEHIVRSTL